MNCRELISRIFDKIFTFTVKNNNVFYVNGAETLPAPLSPEEEAELIEVLSFDDNARSKLVEHNLRLVVYIAKRFENKIGRAHV